MLLYLCRPSRGVWTLPLFSVSCCAAGQAQARPAKLSEDLQGASRRLLSKLRTAAAYSIRFWCTSWCNMATCCWQEAVSTSLLSSTCAEGCYFLCRGNRPTMGLASDLQFDTIPRCGCCRWRYSHYSLESHSWGSVQFVENPLWYVNTRTRHCDSTPVLKPRTVTCYCRPAHS